jgi:hypothetical protein
MRTYITHDGERKDLVMTSQFHTKIQFPKRIELELLPT